MSLGVRGLDEMDTVGRRILRARLELSLRGPDKVTQGRLGQLVAEGLGRSQPITAATVSRWESDESVPDLQTLQAIAAVCGVDPGWLAFGAKTRAPRPTEGLTGVRAIRHEGEILAAQYHMEREAMIERAAASDRERRTRLVGELQALMRIDSDDARRQADEVIRQLHLPSHLERLGRDLFGSEEEHERLLENDPEYRRRWYGEDDEDDADADSEEESE